MTHRILRIFMRGNVFLRLNMGMGVNLCQRKFLILFLRAILNLVFKIVGNSKLKKSKNLVKKVEKCILQGLLIKRLN